MAANVYTCLILHSFFSRFSFQLPPYTLSNKQYYLNEIIIFILSEYIIASLVWLRHDYRMNRSSLYLGRVHISLSTMSSSLSMW